MREYRVVCGNGYHIWGHYTMLNKKEQRELAQSADRKNPQGSPHRLQYRDLPEWLDLEPTSNG